MKAALNSVVGLNNICQSGHHVDVGFLNEPTIGFYPTFDSKWIFILGTISQSSRLGLVDKELSIAAKHSKLKGLLNPISVSGGLDNPLVEVEYRGRQSNVILTTQGESTLKIFGE